MKKINIFINSSTADINADRVRIDDFFRRLNDSYLDKGLYFTFVISVETILTVGSARQFGGYDAELPEHDLVFFVVSENDGSHVLVEYTAALKCCDENNRSKAMLYLKADTLPQTGETLRLIDRIYHETGYYCNTYKHIDTLLLGILIQIRLLGLDGVDIRLESGRAWQGANELLVLDNVDLISGHKELGVLRARLAELDDAFNKAKTHFWEKSDDVTAYKSFFDLSQQRNTVLEEINNIEQKLYAVIESMYNQITRGELSARQAESYWLIWRGEFRRAAEVLDYDAIINDSRVNDDLADRVIKRAQIYVNELLQLKETYESLVEWRDVELCYLEAARIEERYDLPRKATLAYAKFLFEQSRQNESVKVAERLLYYYRNPAKKIPDIELGRFYKFIGGIYYRVQRMQEAEAVFDDAISIFAKTAPSGAYSSDLLDCYDQLGLLFREAKRFAEAEAVYKSAHDILKRLIVLRYDLYEPIMGKNYLSLGNLYKDMRRLDEAESVYRKALEIWKKLAARDQSAFEADLAKIYTVLGDIFYDAERMAESEEMYKPALEIQMRLAGRNPEAFEPDLAIIYNSLGLLYWVTERYEEAERMHRSALEIRKRLSDRSPEAFEKVLANSYNGLGAVYYSTQQYAKAEDVFKTSLEIRLKLSERNPGAYELYVSDTYSNLASIYQETERFAEAEEMFRAAQKIIKNLAAGNPGAFESDLADIYYNMGSLYKVMQRIAEAENAGRTALRLYSKYAGQNPYCSKMADETLELLGSLYDMQETQMKGSLLNAETVGLFAQEEREVALLLIEGDSQRDISRKLHLTSAEVSRRVNAIREKVGGTGDFDPVNAAVSKTYKLTRRESDMLHCLRRGMTNAEIAADLYLSEETVKIHVRNLIKKLPVENRQDISLWVEKFMGSQY